MHATELLDGSIDTGGQILDEENALRSSEEGDFGAPRAKYGDA